MSLTRPTRHAFCLKTFTSHTASVFNCYQSPDEACSTVRYCRQVLLQMSGMLSSSLTERKGGRKGLPYLSVATMVPVSV